MAEAPSSSPLRQLNQFRSRAMAISYTNDISNAIYNTITAVSSSVVDTVAIVSSSVVDTVAAVSSSIMDRVVTNYVELSADISSSNVTISSSISDFTQTMESQSNMLETVVDLALSTTKSTNIQVYKEVPIGSIDGTNAIFELRNEPAMGSEHLYLNGILVEDGPYSDYTISGSVITFCEPLLAGMKLHCTYYYAATTIVRLFADKEQPYGAVDGTNISFALAHEPILGSEHVYLNGILQESSGEDYSMNANVISFTTAPESGSRLRCTYYYEV